MSIEIEDEGLFPAERLIAPKEIIGQLKTAGGYTKTTPREWTDSEITWMQEKKQQGFSVKDLAIALDRSEISVQIKLKRLGKSGDTYNTSNRDKKYEANAQFLARIKPKSVLDVYAGNSWWATQDVQTISNDKDAKFQTNYSLDALDLLCKMKIEGKRFDIIDLDPYGSAYECFDLALKLARKGLIVSFGEWGHKRWKRIDFVEPRYGIKTIEEYGHGELFIKELQRLARCNKKQAIPVVTLQYANFVRVYFELIDIKITEQWEESENEH